ncbi:hypothetical protein [Shewanella piezotolerans]|uniref:hypothetical protein n=1 Tax=Shewanella piezotolerans TaxID=404011 RepID=UPI000312F59A|nr:hypothetical protein [Shewanella piezotolerans]
MRRLDLKEASQVSGGVHKIIVYVAQEVFKASISNVMNGHQGQPGAPSEPGGSRYDGAEGSLTCEKGKDLNVNKKEGTLSCT